MDPCTGAQTTDSKDDAIQPPASPSLEKAVFVPSTSGQDDSTEPPAKKPRKGSPETGNLPMASSRKELSLQTLLDNWKHCSFQDEVKIPKQPVQEGEFSKVYKSKRRNGDTLAIKLIKKPKYEGRWHLLNTEINILHMVHDQANIVKFCGIGECPTGPFLAMEFLDGDLKTYLRRPYDRTPSPKPLREQQIKSFLRGTLAGLDYLHGKKVVHLDLTSENLLLDNTNNIKICDFGLARSLADSTSSQYDNVPSQFLGTKQVMAPERLMDDSNIGYESDIWSTGCLLIELMTREDMFDAKSTRIHQLRHIFLKLQLHVDDYENMKDLSSKDLQELVNAVPILDYTLLKEAIASRFPQNENKNKNKNKNKKKNIAIVATVTDNAYKFLARCLAFQKDLRLTSSQALAHSWLQNNE